MDAADRQPERKRARRYPIEALLALFVGAALLALAGKLLPRGLSRLARRGRGGAEGRPKQG
jgi:hypothetical protein